MATAKEDWINNGVEIRYSAETKGRGLFSTKAFKAQEVLMVEEPLVSCQFSWNATYGYSACDFCMKPLETAEENARRLTGNFDLVLPYPECDRTTKDCHEICPLCAITYCRAECRDRAWNQYHKTICVGQLGSSPEHPLEKLNEAWKVMHYPPETASIMLIVRILASVLQNPQPQLLKSQLLNLCHRTVNEEEQIAHKLLGDRFGNQLETLRSLTSQAMGYKEDIQEFLTPEGFRSLLALIGRNGQGVGTSSFSAWLTNVDNDGKMEDVEPLVDSIYEAMEAESGMFLNVDGSALYARQSACNHSCEPNCEATFLSSDHTLSLVATRDVAEGDELFISYLNECSLSRSRHSRQKILKENYLFVCRCSKCDEQADQADVTSEEDDDEEDGDMEED